MAYLIAAALVAAATTQATVGHGPAMEAAIRAATSASSRTRIHCARAHVAKLPSRMQIRPDTKPAGWWQQNGWAPPSARTPLVANLASTGCFTRLRVSATNHQRSCAVSHSSPSSVPACAASVLAHAPERGTQAGELLLQIRSGPATGTCSEADDGDDASEADDVAGPAVRGPHPPPARRGWAGAAGAAAGEAAGGGACGEVGGDRAGDGSPGGCARAWGWLSLR